MTLLDVEFLANSEAPDETVQAASDAVRAMWEHGDGRIDRGRLKESMRRLLDRPAFAAETIRTVSEWKDWEASERVFEQFNVSRGDGGWTREEVVRYFVLCARDMPADAEAPPPHD